MERHLLSVLDVDGLIPDLLELADQIKERGRSGKYLPMDDMTLGMIFEKPSTRTRLSFEVGATQLGGHAIYLGKNDLQLGRGETIADTARVISRYVDIIMYRAFRHEHVRELAENANVPVIHALCDLEHPCQTMADLMTIRERKFTLDSIKTAYVGDGNNVCNSLLLGAASVGMDLWVATPPDFRPDAGITEKAMALAAGTGAEIVITDSPQEAVKDADVVYTDTWISMGDEKETAAREKIFSPYRVNRELVALAEDDYIFMHCLPAHRGQEVTDEVIDSHNSAVLDQAENRLHAQKAIMLYLLGLVEI